MAARDRIRSREDLHRFLAADARAFGLDRVRPADLARRPTLRFQRLLRRTEFAVNVRRGALWAPYVALLKALLQRRSTSLGFTIPLNVAGAGLCLPHWGTIVISRAARIGEDCLIHASTNIGEGRGGAPRVGSHCYIGPGAVLFGNIELGENCIVGANAVVNSSFPANAVLAGAPARVIRTATQPWPRTRRT